jgi:hypothetical protein
MQIVSRNFLSNVVALRRGNGHYGHVAALRAGEQQRWQGLIQVKEEKPSDMLRTATQEYDRYRKQGWSLVDHLVHPFHKAQARVMQHREWKSILVIYPTGVVEKVEGLKLQVDYANGWRSPAQAEVERLKRNAKLPKGARGELPPMDVEDQKRKLLKAFKEHAKMAAADAPRR